MSDFDDADCLLSFSIAAPAALRIPASNRRRLVPAYLPWNPFFRVDVTTFERKKQARKRVPNSTLYLLCVTAQVRHLLSTSIQYCVLSHGEEERPTGGQAGQRARRAVGTGMEHKMQSTSGTTAVR